MEIVTLLKLEKLAKERGYRISKVSSQGEESAFAIMNNYRRFKTSESIKDLYTYLLENTDCDN